MGLECQTFDAKPEDCGKIYSSNYTFYFLTKDKCVFPLHFTYPVRLADINVEPWYLLERRVQREKKLIEQQSTKENGKNQHQPSDLSLRF